MSNTIWPMWGQPARTRVLVALSRHPGKLSVRDIARLAHVSPSTALRISKELVRSGTLERKTIKRETTQGYTTHQTLLEVAESERRKLRLAFGNIRSTGELLKYLAQLDAPVWVVSSRALALEGISRRVPTFIALPRSWVGRFQIPRHVPVAVFEQAGALQRATGDKLPPIDLLIALLKIDTAAAAQFYAQLRITGHNRRTLLRRINAEGLRDAALKAGMSLDQRRGKRSE